MGRPQWETIVAQAPREKLVTSIVVKSGSLVANAGETINIFAPTGYVSKVISLRLDIPAIGTAGYTQCYVRFQLPYTGPNPDAGGIDILGGRASFGQVLKFNLGFWENADNMQKPSDVASQTAIMRGLEFDDTVPLQFLTSNNTNATITADRIYSVTTINRLISK